jgi:multidrug efflux pump subunit AcrA (membrane-fusion protein)
MNQIHPTDDLKRPGPSRLTLLVLALLLVVLVAAGFFAGYLPRRRRESVLAAESKVAADSLPVVNVQKVKRAEAKTSLVLPGNIQAVTEAPVLARASGYIKRRYADIGDRVKEGQVLAEIEAPELNQQIRQAKATVDQANSTVEQAQAALQQGHSNENLARVTAQRWENLSKKGVVSRQENDTYQAQWAAQQANIQALEKAVAAARNNVSAVEANVARLNDLLAYQTVRAPFAGVITLRNVEAGPDRPAAHLFECSPGRCRVRARGAAGRARHSRFAGPRVPRRRHPYRQCARPRYPHPVGGSAGF